MRFETMIRGAAVERGARLVTPATLLNVSRKTGRGHSWTVLVGSQDGPRAIDARFLVDASGRGAALRRLIGSTPMAYSDRLVCRFARVAQSEGRADLDGFTLVEAVPQGWWYLATLPDGARVVAFHTDADLPAARHTRNPDGFSELLDRTTWIRASFRARSPIDRIDRVSARSQRLADPCGNDWCAIGDAAMAFDPLSSQGLFNALYTGVRGGQAVDAALVGDLQRLADYRARLESIWNTYERNRASYYAMERRFADQKFWSRRTSLRQDLTGDLATAARDVGPPERSA
jgi:flavin-dependent dehydrogenase